jgi:hypothetical protein
LVVHLQKVFCCLGTPSRVKITGSAREIGDTAFSDLTSLVDLSFDEGTLKVGVSAFSWCSNLVKAAFPASLIVIEANAFHVCRQLREISFVAESQLQHIRSEAFSDCHLNGVVLPAGIMEIDPYAFSRDVWLNCVTARFSINGQFDLSADSRTVIRCNSSLGPMLIRSNIETIGANAFPKNSCTIAKVIFESGARLREIGSEAFCGCKVVRALSLPESVEIIGDRCFAGCCWMETIEFEGSSKLKRIG